MTIPNFITIGRLLAVPLVIMMIIQGRWDLAFGLFIFAGVSDAVDGLIARRFDMRSELGAYLDPVADKALLVSIYLTLAITGIIPAWVAILVIFRDILIVSGVILSWLLENPVEMKPLIVSKLNTFAQIAFAAALLAANKATKATVIHPRQVICLPSGASTPTTTSGSRSHRRAGRRWTPSPVIRQRSPAWASARSGAARPT
jgi:cardiolipin synthase